MRVFNERRVASSWAAVSTCTVSQGWLLWGCVGRGDLHWRRLPTKIHERHWHLWSQPERTIPKESESAARVGRRQGGGPGLRSRSPRLCGHSPDGPAAPASPPRGESRPGWGWNHGARTAPAEPPASPPWAPCESPPGPPRVPAELSESPPPSPPRVPRRAPDAPRLLTVRRPAPGRTLTRPMELRLRGQRLHGGVPRTRGERGSHAWRSRLNPASQLRVPPKHPRGADTSTNMAATPKPARLQLRGRDSREEPIGVARAAWR